MAKKTVKDKLNPLLNKHKINKFSSPGLQAGSHFNKSPNQFPVVGIGASAGGLDAFKKLLKGIPENSGMAFVLVQHLHPSHESMLADILQKVTKIPVLEISDDIKVIPDHIYIIPSNKMLVANDGVLLLNPRTTKKNERNLPVDVFFSSLAEVHQAHSIGVVLSGTASDGTLGLKAIKDHGGMTFAQEEASAAYEGMPHSAIQAGVVDFILPPEKIVGKIIELTKITHSNGNALDALPPQVEDVFKQILSLLRVRKGMDFAYYKQATIHRRILRRMALNKNEEPAAYLSYLRENKPEQDILYQDLLIPVTSFFRDPKSFNNLCETVFPSIVKKKATGEPIRAWVAGCSTGQEVYSVAICLKEFLGYNGSSGERRIQIFATDISEPAIVKARTGVYTKSEVESLSPQRLKEFFTKINGSYQVNKSIRDMCVFAVHNFLKDPPFGKLDLISCRNVLIYMEPNLQKKALTTFHYALNTHGFLLLGKSETISSVPELFVLSLSRGHKGDKMFSRKDVPGKYMHTATLRSEQGFADLNVKTISNPENSERTDFQKTADDIMLSKYTPAGVVVNKAMDIVHFRGRTGNYLEQLPGKPSHNLLKLAKEGLAFELRNILLKAKKEKVSVTKENIPVQINGDLRNITIEAMPLPDTIEPHYMVLFHETAATNSQFPIPNLEPLAKTKMSSAHSSLLTAQSRIAQLEKELSQLREDMRSITEDQEAANEELQSANEELLSGSEELQSLNEELETGKEELQSTNEELSVVNQEMISLNEEVNVALHYSEAIIDTIREPLLVLDKNLRVKSANSSFYKTFSVNELETEGRLVYEVGNRQWDIPALRTLLEKLLPEKINFKDFEVWTSFSNIGYRIMMLNAREVVNKTNSEKLILLAIEDVTERKQLEQKEKVLNEIFHNMIIQAPVAIIVLKGPSHVVQIVNSPALDLFGRNPEQLMNKSIFDGLPEIEAQGFKEFLDNVYTNGERFVAAEKDVKVLRNGKMETLYVNFVYDPFRDTNGIITGVVGVGNDVTEQVLARKKVEESENYFRQLTDTVPAIIWITEPDGYCSYLNKNWYDYTGQTKQKGEGFGWLDATHPEDKEEANKAFVNANAEQKPFIHSYRLRNKDGAYRWSIDSGSPKYSAEGKYEGMIGTVVDVHEEKLTEQVIKQSEEKFQGAVAAVEGIVWTNNTKGEMEGEQPAWAALTGQTYEQYQGYGWAQAVHPDDAQLTVNAWNEAVSNHATFNFEHRVRIKDNTWRQFSIRAIPLINADGTIREWVGVHTDITEKRRAENAVKESEEQYYNLIYSSPSAIGILQGEDLVITIANDAIIEIWGKGKEIMGKPYFEALPELAEQGYKEVFHQVYKTGKPFNAVETPVNILQNGKMELKYYNFLLYAKRNVNGGIDGVGIIATEVTSQALFNNKIKESEEQFSTLAENMENLAWIADGEGYIYWYNKRWYDYTGTTLEEMKGLGWQKVHHPDHVDRVVNFIKDAWHKNEPFELTFPLRGTDGEYKWFLTRAYPIADEQGKVMRWIGTNTNIDEQKKAEVEIKYRKALLEAHNESSVDGILLTNDKGKIISFNKRYIEIWNMPQHIADAMNDEVIIAHTLSQLKKTEELIEKNKYIYEHPLEAGSIVLEFKDGKIVERHNYPVMGEDGSFYGVSLTYRDITEQKTAQSLLEYRKALLEAHNESSVDGILLVDAKGKIISYNHRFIEIWNMPPHIVHAKDDEAALAHAMTQLVHPAQFIEKVKWLYEHPTEISMDILEYKDGKIVERHGYPVVADDGSYYAWSWTFRDITEIKKAEFVLRQSEENFRQLAELMPEKVCTADAGGNLTYFNQNWMDYTGLRFEELINLGWGKMLHPGDLEQNKRLWLQAISTGNDFEIEVRIKNKKAEYRWHLSRQSPVKDDNGKIIKWIAATTEIHGQKEQREKLEKAVLARTHELQQANETLGEKNEELISLNKELESFAYVSSHDLQEPLRKIQTFGSYIVEKEKQNLSSSGQNYFNRMQEAAKRMRTLIDDLLAYSRTNSTERKFETINLNNIIDEVKNDLKETIQEKNASIKSGEMCEASIIPFQFRQLFTNLIVNSIKFSIPGRPAHIIIKSKMGAGAELNYENPGLNEGRLSPQKQFCHISIADNGIGFDPDYKERIFNVFQRLHTKDEYPGTGIGLAIVKKIVDNHNGIITASGEKNKGARFDIYIPV